MSVTIRTTALPRLTAREWIYDKIDLIVGVPLVMIGLTVVWVLDTLLGFARHEDNEF